MKIFVAGASGTLGRPLVRALSNRGHEVTTRARARGFPERRRHKNRRMIDAAHSRASAVLFSIAYRMLGSASDAEDVLRTRIFARSARTTK